MAICMAPRSTGFSEPLHASGSSRPSLTLEEQTEDSPRASPLPRVKGHSISCAFQSLEGDILFTS